MTETFDVVTLGEALGGFVAREIGPLELAATFERHIVGAEFNTAVGVCRLGRSASFIGRVGSDGLGRSVLRALRQESVDHRYVTVDEAAATGVLIRTRRGGVPSEVVYHRAGSAGASLAPEHVDAARDAIASARWLHVTGVTPALSASCRAAVELAIAIAHEAGTHIALDLNLRRKLWDDETAARVLMAGIERISAVLGNEDEICAVTGTAPWRAGAQALLERGVSEVVVKRGADGAVLLRQGLPDIEAPARVVSVIDPVGAGDGFDAGYLVGRLEGLDDRAVLALGNTCGALAAGAIGDTTGLPSASELDHLGAHPDEARR
jgi:2-dehydro-3-deoxygluconokinase